MARWWRTSGTGNGQNKVGEIRSGHAGISAACRCEHFKVGYNTTSAAGALDQVVFADDFGASTPGLSVTLQYDAAGNLTDDGLYTYVYDAWNRLVEVKRKVVSGTAPTIATYRYDGLGRRVYKKVEHSGDRNRTEFFYYNSRWQLLEVHNEDDVATRQFMWGTQYIDEAVCMDIDTDGDGFCADEGGSKRYFYCQDANWNVIAPREGSTIIERYEYDPYGECRVLKGQTSPTGPEDFTVIGDSQIGNPIRFAGYYFDNELGTYGVRHRVLEPELGRWIQEDPARYVDRMNLYNYVLRAPVQRRDPKGLKTICCDPDPYVCGQEGEFCCEDVLVFKGHGLFATCKCKGCWDGSIKFGGCVPDGMENGIGSGQMLVPSDVAAACDGLCDGATLTLVACGIGKNEAEMRKLAAACPKIKRVCGYTGACKCIPWTTITLPLPWNWTCLHVNGGPDPKEYTPGDW